MRPRGRDHSRPNLLDEPRDDVISAARAPREDVRVVHSAEQNVTAATVRGVEADEEVEVGQVGMGSSGSQNGQVVPNTVARFPKRSSGSQHREVFPMAVM